MFNQQTLPHLNLKKALTTVLLNLTLGNSLQLSTNYKQCVNKEQALKLTVLPQAEAKGST
jgi:hypothetical protein